MIRFSSIFVGLLLISFGASAQVVATVGNTKITAKDFKTKYDFIKKKADNPPPPEIFLEDMVKFEMGVQEAEKRNLQNDPEVKDGIRQVLYKYLVENEIGAKVEAIKVNENEMRDAYAKNPQIRIAHILIMFPAKATEQQKAMAKTRADELLKEVKASKRPFEELVKLYSDDDVSKMNGGDLGYVSRMTVVPQVYDAVSGLKTGEITGPVKTQFGYQILRVTGRLSYQDSDKSQLRAAVFDQKRKVIFDQFFSQLRSKYKVSKDEGALKNLK